jgi:hypothetical protein
VFPQRGAIPSILFLLITIHKRKPPRSRARARERNRVNSISNRRITIAVHDVALGILEILFGLIALRLSFLLLQSSESLSFLVSHACRFCCVATGKQRERPDQANELKLLHARKAKAKSVPAKDSMCVG